MAAGVPPDLTLFFGEFHWTPLQQKKMGQTALLLSSSVKLVSVKTLYELCMKRPQQVSAGNETSD